MHIFFDQVEAKRVYFPQPPSLGAAFFLVIGQLECAVGWGFKFTLDRLLWSQLIRNNEARQNNLRERSKRTERLTREFKKDSTTYTSVQKGHNDLHERSISRGLIRITSLSTPLGNTCFSPKILHPRKWNAGWSTKLNVRFAMSSTSGSRQELMGLEYLRCLPPTLHCRCCRSCDRNVFLEYQPNRSCRLRDVELKYLAHALEISSSSSSIVEREDDIFKRRVREASKSIIGLQHWTGTLGWELPAIYRGVLSRDLQYRSRDKTSNSITW